LAAAFLLDRLRRGEILGVGEQAEKANGATLPKPAQTSLLRANDLRHYLNQRIAASPSEAANDSIKNDAAPSPKPGQEKAGPVVKSLDAVLTQILAASKSGTPRAVLVAGASANVDATGEVIHIARTLVAQREQVVLIQVIAAGNPKATAKGDETERFTQLFEALTQVYDCVVLHADRDTVRKLTPALEFELSLVVAVLPAGSSGKSAREDLADFSALGCPVVAYQQSGKEPPSGLLALAAI
jgi:hypothetical protein